MKKIFNRIFIDGLSGMALGLFATLIIGTILNQIASFIPGIVGTYLTYVASFAKTITGAGIGVGVAAKLKSSPLTAVSAAVCGMVGAFPIIDASKFAFGSPGEPLGAFIAAYIGWAKTGKGAFAAICNNFFSRYYLINKTSLGFSVSLCIYAAIVGYYL